MNSKKLLKEGEEFRNIDKTKEKEDYVAWASKVTLFVQEKYPGSAVAEKSEQIFQQLFMAYKVDAKYEELMGILKGINEKVQSFNCFKNKYFTLDNEGKIRSMIINHNIAALNAQRQLTTNTSAVQ